MKDVLEVPYLLKKCEEGIKPKDCSADCPVYQVLDSLNLGKDTEISEILSPGKYTKYCLFLIKAEGPKSEEATVSFEKACKDLIVTIA